ncbi:hypothetical protein D3C75_1365310 [compost metagenome]
MMQNRTSDQMRIEGNEEHIVNDAVFFSFSPVSINKIGNLRESKEADSEWKCQVEQRNLTRKQ